MTLRSTFAAPRLRRTVFACLPAVAHVTGKRERRLVRKGGLEPPYPFGYQILSLARLPVPPLSPTSSSDPPGSAHAESISKFGGQAVRTLRRSEALRGRARPERFELARFVTRTSFTGPRSAARELMARLAGTRRIASPARRASWPPYSASIKGVLELESTTMAPRRTAPRTACWRRC